MQSFFTNLTLTVWTTRGGISCSSTKGTTTVNFSISSFQGSSAKGLKVILYRTYHCYLVQQYIFENKDQTLPAWLTIEFIVPPFVFPITRDFLYCKGTGVTTNALHPGSVDTEISRNSMLLRVLKRIFSVFFLDTKAGAQTTIYCAVADELEGVTGKYFR